MSNTIWIYGSPANPLSHPSLAGKQISVGIVIPSFAVYGDPNYIDVDALAWWKQNLDTYSVSSAQAFERLVDGDAGAGTDAVLDIQEHSPTSQILSGSSIYNNSAFMRDMQYKMLYAYYDLIKDIANGDQQEQAAIYADYAKAIVNYTHNDAQPETLDGVTNYTYFAKAYTSVTGITFNELIYKNFLVQVAGWSTPNLESSR